MTYGSEYVQFLRKGKFFLSTGSITPLTEQQKSEENTSLELPAHWLQLSVDEKAFAVAYVENTYSVTAAASAIGMTPSKCQKMLTNPKVRKAIHEVQSALGEIDFLNDKWVREQLLKLYPKLVGEESVPLVDSSGLPFEAKKFFPEAAIKVLEYVSPKSLPGKAGSGVAVQVNIDLGALGISNVNSSVRDLG